ncbi:NACHT, LRR and PYD domains-containing protein 3-like [Neoarius graeffei]|uniref:NACHT, LRR and PYD domains-containing protein 3-like n=1 Tax=Neoarius graeffei TaxID=443677 RepID=UPI00298CAD19|nr:NACHT, LRR and PYD domains-containing protein 3-like [Neoarius graeffei]
MSGECEEITTTEMSLPEGKCKNQGATEKRPNSPEVSCVSLKSERSMPAPINFKGGTSSQESEMKERPVSPGPSCVSFQSDGSMAKPLHFTDGASSVERTPKQEPENSCRNWMESVFQLEHKVITMVKNELNNLKKLLSADYPECSEREEKAEEEEDLDRIRESVLKITLRILKNLKQKDLAHQLQIKLASVYQRKLKSRLGDKFKRINEGISQHGTSVLLNQIYTELYITEGWSEDISNEHEVRQIETVSRRPVTEEKPIKCHDLFKDTSIRSVLTKGVAGIGKTVSVQKFILDWTEGKVNQDVTFMFPLPFRELNLMKQQNLSLMNLLHQFFPDIKGLEVIDSDTYKILLIFDGLDECRLPLDFQNNERLCDVTESASVDVLLTNLIKGNLLPSALLWITTRPAAANQIPPESVDQATEVRGFSDSQKEEYFRKISDQSLANKIITHMKSSRSLDIMCHIPVFCWISATVLERMLGEAESGEIPKTLTQMFTHFLIFQIKHKGQKYHGTYEPDPQQTRESILALGKLAFQQLEKGNLIFYEEDLRECGIGVREVAVYSGVCTQIFRKESGLHLGKMFSFVHLSIQEFLAALYAFLCFLDKNPTKEQTTALSGLFNTSEMPDFLKGAVDQALQSDTGHLDLFLRFLLGLSVESNQKLIRDLLPHTGSSSDCQKDIVEYIKFKFEQNPSPERLINLFYCLNELNDDSLVKEIQSYMSSGRLSEAELSPAQWSALVFVLLTSDEDLEVFQLQKFIKSDECFKRLLPVVQQATTVLLSDCKLTERSCSALHTVLSSESSKLTEVDLSSNHLEDSGVKQLCVGLESPNCKLEKLRISDCSITEEGYAALAEALKSSHLRELDLRGNDPGASGVKLLTDLLQDPDCKLTTLRLSDCRITEEGYAALAEALKSSHLIELDLRGNDPGASGVKLLTDLLQDPDCKLEKLRLRKSGVTEEGCSALTSSFLFNPAHIKELDLSENKVGNSGVQRVCALLKHQPCNLQILRLSDCSITEEGYAALAEALRLNPSSHLRELDLRGNDPGASGVKLLTDLLQDPHCKLTTLRLRKSGVTEEGCSALTSSFLFNPAHIKELDLSENKLRDSGVKKLSALLEDSHCKFQKIRLSDCRITEEGYTALAEALKSSHLIELDLRGNDPGASGVKLLTDLLQDPDCKLTTLRLRKNGVTEEGCSALTSSFLFNPAHIKELDLSENKVGNSGVQRLSAGLKHRHCKLEILRLCNCSVAAEGCAALAAALEENPSQLRELDLSGNKAGDSGIKHISNFLQNSHCLLETLKLCQCRLSEEDCGAIVSALRTNPSHLKELDLSENTIGDSGVKELSDLLHNSNCTLEKLKLSNCSITVSGCADLISALTSNPSHLTELDLSENTLGNPGVTRISTLLKSSSCKLQTLRLSDCNMTEKGYTDLAEALKSQRSSHLRELDLRGNDPGASGMKEFRNLLNDGKCTLRLLKSPNAQKAYDHVTKVVGINPILQTDLNLSGKIAGDSGAEQLSALLKDPHCRAEKLQLRECNLTEKGCSALLTALRSESSTLRELNLSQNRIQDSGVKLLSAELKNPHCKLETVRLSDCSITEEGYTALAEALKLNPSSHLRELDLRGNDPGASGVQQLTDCKTNKLTLRLLKSAEAEEAYNLLTRMFSKNPLLHTELDLSYRKLTDVRVDQLSALLQDPHYRLQKLT